MAKISGEASKNQEILSAIHKKKIMRHFGKLNFSSKKMFENFLIMKPEECLKMSEKREILCTR